MLGDLVDVAGLFREVLDAPDGREALVAVLSYISSVQPMPADRIRRFLRVNVNIKSEREFVSIFEQARRMGVELGREEGLEEGLEKGIEQGIQRGLEQGLARGRTHALRSTLSGQLDRKFGDAFDSGLRCRVDSAGESQLTVWLDRVLDAERIDGVFDA